MTAILGGQRNVGVGSNTLEGNTIGNNNVAIGYYAGGGATGNGNVLIGPAPDGNSTNVTNTPPTPSGDNQLVIGSGTSTWIRGDSSFDVTLPQNANVGGNLTISGNLTVNGTTTTINTNVLSVDDKLIDVADVSARTFTAAIVSSNANITAISPVTGLIPGMAVSISTAGLSVPGGTTIVSITNNTAVLSNPVTGSSGSATFVTTGATDTTADGGGIRIKGTTDKSITYVNATTALTSTENFDLATGKAYRIGNVQIANGSTTTLGPTTGAWSIGAGVTSSSLTSVGTLSSLGVSGAISSTFSTVGSAALTITNDAATALANSTFNIAKTVKGGIHFGNAAGTGGAARQAAITFRGGATDEAHAGIYVINNSTIGTAMTLCTTDNYTTGPQQGITISHTGEVTIPRAGLTVSGVTNLKQITETSVNNFNTSLAPSSGTLTVDTSAATVVLGDLNASVTTWAFTNVPAVNNKATTVTVIIDGDTAQTYGDACNVNGSAVSGGVKWPAGTSPSASNNFDIITFTIVRDGAGTINVFGSATMNYS